MRYGDGVGQEADDNEQKGISCFSTAIFIWVVPGVHSLYCSFYVPHLMLLQGRCGDGVDQFPRIAPPWNYSQDSMQEPMYPH